MLCEQNPNDSSPRRRGCQKSPRALQKVARVDREELQEEEQQEERQEEEHHQEAL